ncbi:unnamed protein product, partial [Prorocentrum cordatum]
RAEKVGALGEAWATACIASGQQRQSARVGAAPKFSGGGAPARGEPKVQAPAPGARQREGQR